MKRFYTDALKEGDFLCGRNLVSAEGATIRAILGGCVSNHNALVIRHNTRGWGIGDMFPPRGTFMPFSYYEELVDAGGYEVRVVRIKDATPTERRKLSLRWQIDIDSQPYSSFSVKRLWVYRIVNTLPWHIKGVWCTRALGIVCKAVFPPERNPFRKIYVEGMPLKKNETPRTIENRLVQGLLEDVTDHVLIEVQ